MNGLNVATMNGLNDATRRFILAHRTENVRELALRGCRDAEVDLREALVQIAGWQQARTKLPRWAATEGLLYPPHLSMEQCSSELTALYKKGIILRQRRSEEAQQPPSAGVAVCIKASSGAASDAPCKQGVLTDLTGGLGIDFSTLAPLFARATYVERQELLCHLAGHNFPLLGLEDCRICRADGVEYLQAMEETVDWIYLDPARRNQQGGKVVAIADCEPNAAQLESLLLQKSRHVMLKLSPMLDLTRALQELHSVEAAYVVAVDGECKELLLILGPQPPRRKEELPITCVNLRSTPKADKSTFITAEALTSDKAAESALITAEALTFTKAEEQQAPLQLAQEPMAYLYEPHAALLKAGAFCLLTQRYPVKKLHPNSHLYTSAEPLPHFPGRRFRIMGWSTLGKRELKPLLADLKSANLTVRNFPLTTDALRRKLKLADGGPTTLFATTLQGEKHILIKAQPLS